MTYVDDWNDVFIIAGTWHKHYVALLAVANGLHWVKQEAVNQ